MPPSPSIDASITQTILSLVLDVGKIILEIYATYDPQHAEHKADGSPLTRADREAELLIHERLSSYAPAVPVVGEESMASGDVVSIKDTYFLVDPLDGTKEFLKRNGEFTVNIAVIDKGNPVMGVVSAPALGEIFWYDGACARHGRIHDGKIIDPQRITVRDIPKQGWTVLESRSHAHTVAPEDRGRHFPNLPVFERKPVGSSLKICRIAQGLAEFYPRLGPTMQWDTAAAHAILKGAGGDLYRYPEYTPLSYTWFPDISDKQRPLREKDFRNPFFIAFSKKEILEGLLWGTNDGG